LAQNDGEFATFSVRDIDEGGGADGGRTVQPSHSRAMTAVEC